MYPNLGNSLQCILPSLNEAWGATMAGKQSVSQSLEPFISFKSLIILLSASSSSGYMGEMVRPWDHFFPLPFPPHSSNTTIAALTPDCYDDDRMAIMVVFNGIYITSSSYIPHDPFYLMWTL